MQRRQVLCAGVAATASVLTMRHARAQQEWPARPVRFIAGGNAGGASDIMLRLIEAPLREKLGQPMIIEPKPGAGGMVGAEYVARAPADGYTFYINHIASHGIGPTLYGRSLSFDPLKDVPGVARMATMPNVMIVKPDLAVRTPKELADYIRANPGSGMFSSAGAGTTAHLSGLLFGMRMGVEVTHVPYRGTAPGMGAVLAGEVLFSIDNAPASRQQVLSGMLRALGVSTGQRSVTMPELPTLQEQGVADFDVASWYGISAPAGVPPAIIARLSNAVLEAMRDPDVISRFREFGADPAPMDTASYNAFMAAEKARWAPLIEMSGAVAG